MIRPIAACVAVAGIALAGVATSLPAFADEALNSEVTSSPNTSTVATASPTSPTTTETSSSDQEAPSPTGTATPTDATNTDATGSPSTASPADPSQPIANPTTSATSSPASTPASTDSPSATPTITPSTTPTPGGGTTSEVQPSTVFITVWWDLPQSYNGSGSIWPQSLSLSQSGPSCGTGWQQHDSYADGTPSEKARVAAILSDGMLTEGEDYGVAQNYAVIKQTACPPVVVTPPTVPVSPPVTPTPPTTPVTPPTIVPPASTSPSPTPRAAALNVKRATVTATTPVPTAGTELAYTGSDDAALFGWPAAGALILGGVLLGVSKIRNRRKKS